MKNKKTHNQNSSMAINNRALKMIYKKYPQLVISTILSSIWSAVTPYVGIYLSALIIEELAGARNVEKLKLLVIVTVVSLAFISLISALLNKWNEAHTSNLWYKFEKFYTEKLFEMDKEHVIVDDRFLEKAEKGEGEHESKRTKEELYHRMLQRDEAEAAIAVGQRGNGKSRGGCLLRTARSDSERAC